MTCVPTIIVTMAGTSSRFSAEGVKCPKWQLRLKGRSLLWWSLRSLACYSHADVPFIFIAQRAHAACPFIERAASALRISRWQLLEIDSPTNGQATTVMTAMPLLSSRSPIGIYNIDTHVSPEHLPLPPADCDGWIPHFSALEGSWSYVRLNPDGVVTQVAEKLPISTHASIGFYYFRRFEDFEEAYWSGASDSSVERYVAPLYNDLIRRGARILGHDVPRGAVIPLGTPAELDVMDSGWRELWQR